MGLVRLPVFPLASMVLTLVTFSTANAQAQSTSVYTLDQTASVVGFTIYGSTIFKIRREGQFKDFTGQLAYNPARPGNTQVNLTVFTASVDMHNAEHDQLLKSSAFFDVDHYPTMHFSSSSTGLNPDGTFVMTGDMTIRGITKRMTIPVRLRQNARVGDTSGAVFETTFEIDRSEFGLNGTPHWNGFKVSISKNVQIHIAIATALNGSQLMR